MLNSVLRCENVSGSEGTTPRIDGSEYEFHVPNALLPRAKCSRHPVSGRQVGNESRPERYEKEKNYCPCRESSPVLPVF
jgi:hypothetical protein